MQIRRKKKKKKLVVKVEQKSFKVQDYKRERWDLFPLADFAFYANSDFASDSLASQSEDFEVLGKKTYLTNFKLKLYLCGQKGFLFKIHIGDLFY